MKPRQESGRLGRRALRESMPVAQAVSGIVNVRARNNGAKGRGTGFRARVADNDPMAKDSESNWP